MMTIPDLSALTVVVRSLREDWDHRAIRDQLTKLAEDYDHPDVAYAAVQIARDHSNRAPVTLTIKAPDLIARLHATTSTGPRTPGPASRDASWLCDTCGRRHDQCVAVRPGIDDDHPFVSIAEAEAQRDAEWALAGKPRRSLPAGAADLFTLPEDV
jgi:hypothetical protein